MENINNLNKKLKDLKKEIANYQKNCSHKKQTLRAQDNNDVRFVCDTCFSVLRWPNSNELRDWLKR